MLWVIVLWVLLATAASIFIQDFIAGSLGSMVFLFRVHDERVQLLLLINQLLLVLVYFILHQLQLHLLVMFVLLHEIILPRKRLSLATSCSLGCRQLTPTRLLLSRFLQVTSVFLPHVRHFPQCRIVKERVLRTCLLRHALTRVMLLLLTFVAVRHNLILLAIESFR